MDFNIENREQFIKQLLDQYDSTKNSNSTTVNKKVEKPFQSLQSFTSQEYLEQIRKNIASIDYQILNYQQRYQQNLETIEKAVIYSAGVGNWSITTTGIKKYLDAVLNGNYDIIVPNDNLRESIKNLCLENERIKTQLEKLNMQKANYQDIEKQLTPHPKINLDTEILPNMPNNLNEEEICRYLYFALAKKTRYDVEFILTKNPNIYNKKMNINDLESNRVICNGWAELYKQLLIHAGISEERIKIVGENKPYDHKYVEIYFDQYKILADATSSYADITDLIAIKIGMNTTGFVRANLDLTLSNFEERKQYFCTQTIQDMKWLNQLDLKADTDWKKNIYDEVNYAFHNSYLYSKIFGTNCDRSIGLKMNRINEKLKKLDSFEAYGYLLNCKKNLFSEEEAQNIRVALLYQLDGQTKHYDVVSCISIKNMDHTIHYYFSTENQGLIEVTKSDIINNGYKGYIGEDFFEENTLTKNNLTDGFQTSKPGKHMG